MASNLWEAKNMIKVPLREVKDRLSHFVDEAAKQQIVITRHGKPAAVLIGFADEDEWFEYRLLHDPRFQQRISEAREQAKSGKLTKLEDIPD
jgi:prevent-host-death family protein